MHSKHWTVFNPVTVAWPWSPPSWELQSPGAAGICPSSSGGSVTTLSRQRHHQSITCSPKRAEEPLAPAQECGGTEASPALSRAPRPALPRAGHSHHGTELCHAPEGQEKREESFPLSSVRFGALQTQTFPWDPAAIPGSGYTKPFLRMPRGHLAGASRALTDPGNASARPGTRCRCCGRRSRSSRRSQRITTINLSLGTRRCK